jgi:hypothetical protein
VVAVVTAAGPTIASGAGGAPPEGDPEGLENVARTVVGIGTCVKAQTMILVMRKNLWSE